MQRLDFRIIADWIESGSRVLDLGCEDGELLIYLRQHRQVVRGIGVDVNHTQLNCAIARGISVIDTDIRQGLSLFANQSFDYVILSQTLQNIDQSPQSIIEEMLRIGRVAIVSFPNFGHWQLRQQLLRGKMPVGGQLPYQWYDTPYVRYCTIADFEQWCHKQKLRIVRPVYLDSHHPIQWAANLRARTAIYQLTLAS